MYIESVSVMLTERSWWNEIQTTNSKYFLKLFWNLRFKYPFWKMKYFLYKIIIFKELRAFRLGVYIVQRPRNFFAAWFEFHNPRKI